MTKFLLPALLAAVCGLGLQLPSASADPGHLVGQFILDGDVPKPKVIIEKGASVKDAAVCAAKDLYDETLVVDPKTKGIANIVVYLRKVDEIDPKAEKIPEEQLKIVFDQKNCQFLPHVLGVRNGQTVLVKSDDPVPHNTHTHPFANDELNFVVRPNDREGVPVKYEKADSLPVKVNCDLHPHMTAYWVVLDHPYFAITDAQGKFKIENLPPGDYDFVVWHERVGFVDRKDEYIQEALEVTIEEGKTEDIGEVEVPLELLEK